MNEMIDAIALACIGCRASDLNLASLVAEVMLHTLWLNAVVAAGAFLLLGLLVGSRPQIRYVTAVAALVLMALVPPLAAAVLAQQRAAEGIAIRDGLSGGYLDVPAFSVAAHGQQPSQVVTASQSIAAPPQRSFAFSDGGAVWVARLIPVLPWVWASGTTGLLLFWTVGLLGTHRLRRVASESDPALLATADRLRTTLGLLRPVAVAISGRVTTPLVLGVLRPLILIPPAVACGCSPQQLEMILLHELAHVRRWDNLFNLMQRLIEAFLYFHPGVWLLSRRVRLERELCCDAAVLAVTEQPQAYAETLAMLALPQLTPQHALAALATHRLVHRIRTILAVEEPPMRLSRTFIVAPVLAAAALVLSAVNHWPSSAEAAPQPVVRVPEQADPLAEIRTQVGATRTIEVVGRSDGSLWGSDVYTDDSDLGTAAVHAGILKVGEKGFVRVTILPGQDQYSGSKRHGASSYDYGPWPRSFHVARAQGIPPEHGTMPPGVLDEMPLVGGSKHEATTVIAPGTIEHTTLPGSSRSTLGPGASALRSQVGATIEVLTTGRLDGAVWGTDIYTDDSDVGTSAVHAGLLQPGQTGTVSLVVLPGRNSYEGAERNGVKSMSYGNWGGSYVLTTPRATLRDQRGRTGETVQMWVTGRSDGVVWGTDVYTGDSDENTAAVHAGLVEVGETKRVLKTMLPGRSSYKGSQRGGVTSHDWGQYGSSYWLEPIQER